MNRRGTGEFVFTPEDLTREKDLFEVFCSSLELHRSKLNQGLVFAATIVFLCVAIQFDLEVLCPAILAMANSVFSFTTAMLGFLLAGFTVSATLGKVEFLKVMALYPYPDSRLSYLKYTYLMFMRVMVVYLLVACFCAAVAFLGPFLGRLVAPGFPKLWLARCVFVVLGAAVCLLFATLQSFIFNIYHVVMASIRWEFEKSSGTETDEKPSDSCQGTEEARA